MKKTKLCLSILSLTLMGIIAVFAVIPALATPEPPSTKIVNSGTGSMVYLNLPPSVATATVPSHPSNIQLRCYHFDESPMDPFDAILVYLWIPQRNSYNPAALITDAPNIELYKSLWYKTFIWYNTTASDASNMPNVIQVPPTELEIWTEDTNQGNGVKGGWNGESSNVFTVRLQTKLANIKLPFNLWPAPYNNYGDLSFTLANMTLKFRDIGDSYFDSGTNALLPSGYYRQPVSEMRTPAWVEESIPTWLGAVSPQEVVGHIDWHYSEIITPPAT